MTSKEWEIVSRKALQLFHYGQQISAQHGLVFVDTKYEFGKLIAKEGEEETEGNQDTIVVVDEIHTPDSSRYWLADSYPERFEVFMLEYSRYPNCIG